MKTNPLSMMELDWYQCSACEESESFDYDDVELIEKQWKAYRMGAEIKKKTTRTKSGFERCL